MSNQAVNLVREQFKQAHDWLEGTLKDVSPEMANEEINPKAMTIAGQYIHTVTGIDALVLGKFAGKTPLMASTWKDTKGFSPNEPQGGDLAAWSRELKFDLEQVKKYCTAVHQAVDDYLSELKDEDLFKEIDLSDWGMGKQPRSFVLTIAFLNTASHAGEIANMKGMKGLQGYPW